MGKQRRPLPAEEALRRTTLITSLLAKDTWYALRARTALHTANDVILEKNFDGPSRFGDTYNVVQNSLALTVALAIARLFDLNKSTDRYPVEEQDKASIPVLATLLMRIDVQDALAEKARGWLPDLTRGPELGESDCRSRLSTALSLYEAHTDSADHQAALTRLRDFRTGRLAHHLFDDLPTDLPRFDDLNLLAICARDFVRSAVLAVTGTDRDLGHEEDIKRKIDRQFWDIGLSAVLAVEE
jgi:hypothetical protein